MNKKNTFKNDFFWSDDSQEIWATDLVTKNSMGQRLFMKRYLKVKLEIPSVFNYELKSSTWTRKYFASFLSDFSGLALSIYATVRFVMSFFNDH